MIVEEERYDINGHELILRCPCVKEAQEVLDVFIQLNGETRYLIKEPDEIDFSVEDEERFIQMFHHRDNCILLGAYYDGKYIGNCSLTAESSLRLRHRATIGIALLQEYTHQGIGRKMLEKMIRHARELQFEQLELEVMSLNKHAIKLYEKLGFVHCGTIPHALKYSDGSYDDGCMMVKRL